MIQGATLDPTSEPNSHNRRNHGRQIDSSGKTGQIHTSSERGNSNAETGEGSEELTHDICPFETS